jgi:hypothetical protein
LDVLIYCLEERKRDGVGKDKRAQFLIIKKLEILIWNNKLVDLKNY